MTGTVIGFWLSACTGDPSGFQKFHQIEFTESDLAVAQKYAPIFYHEVGSKPRYDLPTKFDFDGDFVGDNNWQNAETMDLPAHIYYSVVDTQIHYYIFYGVYHPRDYERFCLPIFCHENDFEGLTLRVSKTTQQVEYLETEAHNNFYLYTPEYSKDPKDQKRVAVLVEEEGHGVFMVNGPQHIVRQACEESEKPPVGLARNFEELSLAKSRLYWPGDIAEVPGSESTKTWVSYKLLPMSEIWNRIGDPNHQKIVQIRWDYEGTLFQLPNLPMSFYGNDYSIRSLGAAKPPWSWPDNKCDHSPRGDWYFDPARSFALHLGQPLTEADSYVNNPFAKIYDGQKQNQNH